MILGLSHPKGASVNDGIDRTLCSLTYMKVDDVVQQVLSLGKGTLLAKVDIESAFRNIPVHPDDRHLLGMLWDNKLYIDTVLPFGLRSAPKIFNSCSRRCTTMDCKTTRHNLLFLTILLQLELLNATIVNTISHCWKTLAPFSACL